MELPGGGGGWLAPSPSPPGPAVPDRHDEHGVGTFIWPPVGTSTWPPVGCLSICQEAFRTASEEARPMRVSSASMTRQRWPARCLLSARVAYRGVFPSALFLS